MRSSRFGISAVVLSMLGGCPQGSFLSKDAATNPPADAVSDVPPADDPAPPADEPLPPVEYTPPLSGIYVGRTYGTYIRTGGDRDYSGEESLALMFRFDENSRLVSLSDWSTSGVFRDLSDEGQTLEFGTVESGVFGRVTVEELPVEPGFARIVLAGVTETVSWGEDLNGDGRHSQVVDSRADYRIFSAGDSVRCEVEVTRNSSTEGEADWRRVTTGDSPLFFNRPDWVGRFEADLTADETITHTYPSEFVEVVPRTVHLYLDFDELGRLVAATNPANTDTVMSSPFGIRAGMTEGGYQYHTSWNLWSYGIESILSTPDVYNLVYVSNGSASGGYSSSRHSFRGEMQIWRDNGALYCRMLKTASASQYHTPPTPQDFGYRSSWFASGPLILTGP